jgi:hypothetical protein
MPTKKKKAESKAESKAKEAEGVTPSDAKSEDMKAAMKMIDDLMSWYLNKINGDQRFEQFDILLHIEGPNGKSSRKYTLADFQESLATLKSSLESDNADAYRYAYVYWGYWETPENGKFDGAVGVIETHYIKPQVFGYPIAKNPEGEFAINSNLQILGLNDWSLFHRQTN